MINRDEPWRAELVRRSGLVVLAFSLLVGAYVLRRSTRWIELAAYAGLLIVGGLAGWATRISARLRGALLVGILLLAGGVAVRTLGMVPGSVLCLTLGTVLATVLFGNRAGALALLLSSAGFLLLGSAGRVETAARLASEHLAIVNWYRMSAVYGMLTGLLVMLVSGALRRVETSLRSARESEERWRRISEASFEGIGFSKDGVVVDVNEQLARMLGYEADELVGRPVAELIAPEHRELVQSMLRDGQTGGYAHLALRKDGSRVPVETRARLLSEDAGALRVTAVRDMSEQARLQEELKKRERLAAVGAVVAGVAHEVRTPLFGISATLDAHQSRFEATDELRALAGVLRSQVRRLSGVMSDLLDYGRPPELKLARGRLGPVVEAALRSCAALAREADVSLHAEIAEGLPELFQDGERLEQVFHNLLSNAVQHAPRGSQVKLGVVASPSPSGLTCTVEDEGPGLRDDDMAQVFEPFFSRRKGGTGLGLAIVQRIVEQHGGWVRAGHRPGGGAAFTVFLPAAPPEASARTG